MNQENLQEHVQALEKRINALMAICKSQADMIQSFVGSDPANLENFTGNLEIGLSEEDSNMASAKIKRRVTIQDRRLWITANSEQEYAEKLLQAVTQQSVTGDDRLPKKHNFGQYARTWFEVFSRPNIETATAVSYERQLRLYLIPAFGEMDIEDIKTADVQALFNGIHGAKETKLKVKMVLNMIFQQAIEENIIVKNPLASKNLRIKGRAPKSTEPYTVEQMQFIVSKLGKVAKETDRAFIALMALHPLRLEEVLGLKFSDIDRKTKVIHVQRSVTHPTRNQPEIKATKTEASCRDIDLATEILQYLPEGNGRYFIFGGEKPFSYTQVRRMCRRIKKDIGFDNEIQPRRFRTTVLTDIYDATKDITKAQAAAGHTTAAMTLKHYVKGRTQKTNTASSVSALYGLAKDTAM